MTAFVKRKTYQRHLNTLKQQQYIYKSTEYGKLELQTNVTSYKQFCTDAPSTVIISYNSMSLRN